MEDVLDFSFWYPQKQPTNQPTATKQERNKRKRKGRSRHSHMPSAVFCCYVKMCSEYPIENEVPKANPQF